MSFSRSFTRRLLLAVSLGAGLAGCHTTQKAEAPTQRYTGLDLRDVPDYLEGTIYQQANLANTGALQVSGYGLVVNLDGTGDSTAPIAVREFIEKEIVRHDFGSRNGNYAGVSPAEVLADNRVSIVRVDGFIPAGAHPGDRFDVQVSALPGNQTTSLVGGTLYKTTLRQADRVSQFNPGELVNTLADSRGDIFVNPEYAAEGPDESPNSRKNASLRTGVILNGGVVSKIGERPLILRVRQPSRRTARFIEQRIDQYFQNQDVAAAQDEGVVYLYVPRKYGDDWEHFAGVALHLFPTTDPTFAAAKAQELAKVALQPDAPLANISYAWEALGPAALPAIQPLYNSPKPDVAFAAARAAAFLGDRYSQQVLLRMAAATDHPFQLPAVETLGHLPDTPETKRLLRQLLDADSVLVRVQAYEALAKFHDLSIFRQVIEDKFILDIVQTDGPPVIYASRRGEPRIAVIGRPAVLRSPIVFASLGNAFTISTDNGNSSAVKMFHRKGPNGQPVSVSSRPDAATIIARLGGKSAPGEPSFAFDYGQVVALVNDLADNGEIVDHAGRPVTFRLQELPGLESLIRNAEPIPSARSDTGETPEIPDGRARPTTDISPMQPSPEPVEPAAPAVEPAETPGAEPGAEPAAEPAAEPGADAPLPPEFQLGDPAEPANGEG